MERYILGGIHPKNVNSVAVFGKREKHSFRGRLASVPRVLLRKNPEIETRSLIVCQLNIVNKVEWL